MHDTFEYFMHLADKSIEPESDEYPDLDRLIGAD